MTRRMRLGARRAPSGCSFRYGPWSDVSGCSRLVYRFRRIEGVVILPGFIGIADTRLCQGGRLAMLGAKRHPDPCV
jgi:hypothetical protein